MRTFCRPTTAVPAALALLLTLGMAAPAASAGVASGGPVSMGQCDKGNCDKGNCDESECDKKAAAAVRAQPLCDGQKDDKDKDDES